MTDKLRILWPIEPVLFNGKGIGEAWRDEFLRVAPYELTDNPAKADVAFFCSDSVVDPALVGKLPTCAYHWGFYHKRFLDLEYHRFVRSKMQLMSQCDFVLAPSYITQYELYHFGVPNVFLPAGVDENTLNISHNANKKPQIMFLSRLVGHKHLEVLIEAASLLEPKIPVLVSGPGDTSQYKALAEGLHVPVTFCELTDTEKVQAIAESMVLVHPSEYEGFSLPPLEALFLETPVIASDIPQHRHLLGRHALYFYTAEELARRLGDVFNNYSEAQKMAHEGSQFVRDNYTLKIASERLSGILHEAIRKHLGERLRKDPRQLVDIYNKDHRRHWIHQSQYMDQSWYRHWRMQHVLKSLTGETVLDVGGATGVYTVGLAQHGYKVTWFDHSEQAQEYAKVLCEKYQVKADFKLGDAHSLPFESESFDSTWCGELLEHVFEPEKVVAEVVRVAKKRAIFSTPIGRHHFDPLHITNWDDESIAALFKPYNAHIEKIAEEGSDESCYFVVVEK